MLFIIKILVKLYVLIKHGALSITGCFLNLKYPLSVVDKYKFVSLIPTEASCLEIGPFNKPLLSGGNVKYFDVLDQSRLVKRAAELNIDGKLIPEIDFVSQLGDLKVVNEKFEVVLSSHVIEHQSDLISHFKCIEDILIESGRYFMVVPDRRFSFDYFLTESNLAQVLAAHVERREIHVLSSVIEHRCLTTHNNPYLHLFGMHGKPLRGQSLAKYVDNAVSEYKNKDGYIDVHAWYFTPLSFVDLVNKLFEIGLIKLKVDKFYVTTLGKLEFFVVLRKVS